jgi:hypothetical protein
MSNVELGEWLAFTALEPSGEEQANRRTALICAVIEAVNTERGKRPKNGVDGFLRMLRPDPPKPEPAEHDPDKLRGQILALAARSKGKRVKRPTAKRQPEPEGAA